LEVKDLLVQLLLERFKGLFLYYEVSLEVGEVLKGFSKFLLSFLFLGV